MSLIEGLADKFKSLLQMLSIPSVGDTVSFHPGQEGKKTWTEMEGCGDDGIYVCTPTLLPPTLPSCFAPLGNSSMYSYSSPTCISYICMLCECVDLHVCVPASLRCQSVCGGRGALKFVLMARGGREVILRLCVWLESMLIMRKGERWREEKKESKCGAAKSADWLWMAALPRLSDSLSVYFLRY